MSTFPTGSRLLPALGGLATAGLGAASEAPWWLVAILAFAALLVVRAEALVNARNEARRGVHEDRLLGTVPSRQALGHLRAVRRPHDGSAPGQDAPDRPQA
ncbi:hypothetical protein [Streptomyces sp. WAC06614]|uniref:hypothetical protein n=1 Tax=Streptomyces sp. WAC06614 TaxID=2487416 RepID=UPI000F77E21D|nr:hypothetical protein [Streptomyces sp. WAC06614]RSS80081.1 hypothetical protein EF918_15015 [Streptomyces sp. WAC06614]